VRGDAPGAEAALRAALRLNPHLGAARADLGWALLAQARDHDAGAEFARALELDPIHALPRRQLAWRELLLPARSGAA
jgi:Flp pilus assembly protein TadD